VNNLIRDHLDRLGHGYRHVLLDCEAGQEHLSRRTSGRPDALICVVNRSRMAAETIRRSLDLFVSIHGALPRRVQLVLNQFDDGESLAIQMTTLAGGPFSHVVTIPRDPRVAALESAGESLLTLDPASPAMAALGAWEVGL
jgi:CO dehydrogenase maturation factor